MKKLIFPAAMLAVLCLFAANTNAQLQTYTIINSSGAVVTSVTITPTGSEMWGTDLNTAGSVSSDQSFTFERLVDKASCTYDVRYMLEDGSYYYVRNLDLCTSYNITLPAPDVKRDMEKY
jgi:hypothetical protein